jgi:hypothetical protein
MQEEISLGVATQLSMGATVARLRLELASSSSRAQVRVQEVSRDWRVSAPVAV